jgi:hypothetical protein
MSIKSLQFVSGSKNATGLGLLVTNCNSKSFGRKTLFRQKLKVPKISGVWTIFLGTFCHQGKFIFLKSA